MTFCTQCGHQNDSVSKFCDECGAPLSQRSPKKSSRKIVILSAVGAAFIALAVTTAILFQPPAPSNELFKPIVQSWVESHQDRFRKLYCLNNYPYGNNPVFISEIDQQTLRLMNVLSKGGLYSAPEVVTQRQFFLVTKQYKFTKTDLGTKATSTGALCFADGVSVKSINGFAPPKKVNNFVVTQAQVTYQLKNPMAWVLFPDTQLAGLNIKTEFDTGKFLLVLKEGKWAPANTEEVEQFQNSLNATTDSNKPAAASDLLTTSLIPILNQLFSKRN
jgi:hypothetical protein